MSTSWPCQNRFVVKGVCEVGREPKFLKSVWLRMLLQCALTFAIAGAATRPTENLQGQGHFEWDTPGQGATCSSSGQVCDAAFRNRVSSDTFIRETARTLLKETMLLQRRVDLEDSSSGQSGEPEMESLLDACSRQGKVFRAWGEPRMESPSVQAGEAVCWSEENAMATRNIKSGQALFKTKAGRRKLSHEYCTTRNEQKARTTGPPSYTFQEAKVICEAAGLRLCRNQEELDTSCHTGCMFDLALAWVERPGAATRQVKAGSKRLEAPSNFTNSACAFEVQPETPTYWDRGCVMGMHGCNADGKNVQCRFCGKGGYADIPCPEYSVCEFEEQPETAYFWDPECQEEMPGCLADGVHLECRFCGSQSSVFVPCPEPPTPAPNQCTWPLRGVPSTPFFWDETCEMGQLGCFADGLHMECRFCGEGVYSEVLCPNTAELNLTGM